MIDAILAGFLTFVLSWLLVLITLLVGAFLNSDEYRHYQQFRKDKDNVK